MFGVEEVLAFIRRSAGLRTDAASSNGSLHAKMAELLSIGKKPETTFYLYVQTPYNNTSPFTVLSVTGRGKLVRMNYDDNVVISSIVIDGKTIPRTVNTAGDGANLDGLYLWSFSQSLVITGHTANINNGNFYVVYTTEI
jgi:hypothetical protein